MGRWKTYPKFFPEIEDIGFTPRYHLLARRGIRGWETRPSGKRKMYKKVKFEEPENQAVVDKILGFDEWWNKWGIKRGFFRSKWVRKVESK